jgi:uncharacterized RDD family membrane protein YckC
VKCPKCGYLGFESVERCRNCGYDFSLTAPPVPDLALLRRTSEEAETVDDLGFASERRSSAAPADLPLFAPSEPVDQPLITRSSPPRQPLAVRRATGELQRSRAEPRAQTFDLGFDSDSNFRALASALRKSGDEDAHVSASPATIDAGLFARLCAVFIDLLILALVDAAVVYFTAQICGISVRELNVLPKVPLVAFLLAQNGGYLVIFTAGGQTLGKMALGIRVVAADEAEPLDLARAARRTLVWLALAIPAGLGFVTTLFTQDHRGLHDRLAGTRVVRASA